MEKGISAAEVYIAEVEEQERKEREAEEMK